MFQSKFAKIGLVITLNLSIGGIASARSIAIDNITAWNVAKTDFSDYLNPIPDPTNLVFWNTLGSDAELANSQVGPGGTRTGGTFIPGPAPGFGMAFEDSNFSSSAATAQFPSASFTNNHQGTIAFWGKLGGYDSAIPPPGGAIFMIGTPFDIGFATNSGCAAGGLFGIFGVPSDSLCHGDTITGTESFVQNKDTFDSILGDRNAWHYYALTWDDAGVPGLTGSMAGNKVALYLDGNLLQTPFYLDLAPTGWSPIPSNAVLGLINGLNPGSGGGGSPFPEPSTWAMMLLGFAGVGLAHRQRRRTTAPVAAFELGGTARGEGLWQTLRYRFLKR